MERETVQRIEESRGVVGTEDEAEMRATECLASLDHHFGSLLEAKYNSNDSVDADESLHLAPRMNEQAFYFAEGVCMHLDFLSLQAATLLCQNASDNAYAC